MEASKIITPQALKTTLQLMKSKAAAQKTKKVFAEKELDGREKKILEYIYREFEKMELSKPNGYVENSKDFMDSLISEYGDRAIIEVYLSESMIFGVPYIFALANGSVWMAVYLATRNFGIFFGGMMVCHVAAYVYAAITRNKKREEKINVILRGGINLN